MSLDATDHMVIAEIVRQYGNPDTEARRLHETCKREIALLERDVQTKRADLAHDLHEIEKRREIMRRTAWSMRKGQ